MLQMNGIISISWHWFDFEAAYLIRVQGNVGRLLLGYLAEDRVRNIG